MPGRGSRLCPAFFVLHYNTFLVLSQYRLGPAAKNIRYNSAGVMTMMTKFTMPLDEEIAQKLTFIGKYYGRSRIKEIEWACKERIARFEAEQGKITPEDLQAMKDKAGE